MATTTTTTVAVNISGAVSAQFVSQPEVNLVHALFARDIPVGAGQGKQVTARRRTKFSLATSALTEGTDPSSTALAVTDVALAAAQYGMYVEVTDLLVQTDPWPVLSGVAEDLGLNAAETVDKLAQAVLVGGTNVRYANNVAARANVNVPFVIGDIRAIVSAMTANGAKKITGIINAGLGISTVPVNAAYISIAHPYVIRDLKALSGWQSVETYASTSGAFPGEAGKIDDVRFIMSQNADDGTGQTGAAGTTVYRNDGANFYVFLVPFIGVDFYAYAHWSDVQYTNDAGTTALKLTTRHGWKLTAKFGRLVENYGYRGECAASL